MTDLRSLPLHGKGGALHVVVETSRGARVKTAYDAELGALVRKRPLPQGLAYPFDWGFFPSTLSEEGDPLDALVIADGPVPAGVVVPSTPIALLRVREVEGRAPPHRNDRVLVVPIDELDAHEGHPLSHRQRRELGDFFVTVGQSAGKRVTIEGWRGAKEARSAVLKAAKRFGAHPGQPV